jgi:hypothetical protein
MVVSTTYKLCKLCTPLIVNTPSSVNTHNTEAGGCSQSCVAPITVSGDGEVCPLAATLVLVIHGKDTTAVSDLDIDADIPPMRRKNFHRKNHTRHAHFQSANCVVAIVLVLKTSSLSTTSQRGTPHRLLK